MASIHDMPDGVVREETSDPNPVPTHNTLQSLPYSDVPSQTLVDVPPRWKSFFAMEGLLVSFVLPLLMGFGFVALGFYIIHGRHTLVISHSIVHAAVISQAFTALFSVWHFVALIPAVSMVQSVRSEEWWRRLLKGTPFNRANSVSSNNSSTFAHMVEIIVSWSSPYFRFAWIAALVAAVLGDIAPAAIHAEVGLDAVSESFPVPALPANSIYSNYSQPFLSTGAQVHSSIEIAPIYFNAMLFGATYVKAAPPTPNALVPRPNIAPGQGYRYMTDVVFMDYNCSWYAPTLPDPDSTINISTSQTITFTAGGIQGLGREPLLQNEVYPLRGYTDPSTGQPSFKGDIAFVVTSGPLGPGSGFNLNSVPTYTPSASWQAAAAAWRANQTGPLGPVESISVAVCSPRYSIQPWIVDLVNGSTTLVELQSHNIGNIDPTQLNIAIQDCFNLLPGIPPISVLFGTSIAQLNLLLSIPTNSSLPGIPYPAENLTSLMNAALPIFIQAYLDNFPFGNFTSPSSQLLVPAVILSAELNFVCATAVLYALLSATLLYLILRPAAKPFDIQSILSTTREVPTAEPLEILRGQTVATQIERIAAAGNDIDDSATEARINKAISDHYAMVREDLAIHYPVLEVDSQRHVVSPYPFLERYANTRTRRSRVIWTFTPAIGATLVGFSLAMWRHPHVVSYSPTNTRATLFTALFTWSLGLWRSLSLLAVTALIRQANSDEWSRLLKQHEQRGLDRKLRGVFNTSSTNTLSFLDAFRACMTKTSIIFKICFIAGLLAPLCAVVAQGAVTMLSLPSLINEPLTIPILVRSTPVEVPWSADKTLAPSNVGLITNAQLGSSWTYLEQVVGASVGDTIPPGYLVPLTMRTNNTFGRQYPTEVAYVQCECTWVAPILPPATTNPYIPVSLGSFGIDAIQTIPHGIATLAPLSNITFTNSTPVTSGLFAWTLWGGGPGDTVNLASVPSTNLSTAWQELINDQIAPAYIQSFPGDVLYVTNLTRATTLVCDPRIQFVSKEVRDFGGIVNLSSAPAKYSTGVGNLNEAFVSYMVYNYAVQQALDNVGIFRPYIVFGQATGNAILASDPSNPAGGTVPKSTAEIGDTLNAYIGSSSKAWMTLDLVANRTTVDGQTIQQSLTITAALPLALVTAVLYVLLGLTALLVSFRTLEAPFTLAGVLMMHSKLNSLQILPRNDQQDETSKKQSG